MSSWRPALRIARRTIRRNLGRSLLVAVLVGVPVAGATLADVLYRSTSGAELETYQRIGDADAEVLVTSADALYDGWAPDTWDGVDYERLTDDRDPAEVDLSEHLPSGSHIVAPEEYRDARIAVGEGFVHAATKVMLLGDPLTKHEARLESGDWPTASNEAVVTRSLAERLGILDDGDLPNDAEIEIFDGPTVTVTGLSVDPFCLSCESVMTMPESVLDTTGPENEQNDPRDGSIHRYLVDLPDGADAAALAPGLADAGIAMVPREVHLKPDAVGGGNPSMEDIQAIALSALVIGLGLLEIVLLAGAAFAVGARRQTRDLGLAAVNGATGRQVRRMVLAQGLSLGAIGAVLGVVLGALVIVVAEPLWERLLGQLIDTWRFGVGEIALAGGVGLLSGLAAAVIPAVGAARMKPVDALAGRFRASKLATRMPIFGLVLIILGVATALGGNRLIADEFAAYRQELAAAPSGEWVAAPDTTVAVTLQILGAVLAVAGIVIAIPALVTALAGIARRLSFPFRYAVRDAARHRHRTAPTVAAIMIVVTGSVTLAFVAGGVEHAEKVRYAPKLPDNLMAINGDLWQPDGYDPDALERAAASAQEKLPDAQLTEVTRPVYEIAPPDSIPEEERHAEIQPATAISELPEECSYEECWNDTSVSEVAVATPDLFEIIAGRPMDDSERRALESGTAIAFEQKAVGDDGTVTIGADTYIYDDPQFDGWSKPERVTLDAKVVNVESVYSYLRIVLVPADTVPGDATLAADMALLAYGDAADEDVTAAIGAAELQGTFAVIEEGPQTYAGIVAVILAAASAFVTLVGVAIAISLAAAESRADYATLRAVGAPPRRRRLVAGAQALVVGGVGTVLGLALGAYVAFTAWPTTGSPEFVVPWSNLTITGIAVPLLAVLVAMIFTPSRLPMIRRLE